MKQGNEDQFMDLVPKRKKSDEQLAKEIQKLLEGESIISLQSMEKDNRNKIIRRIKGIQGVTQRQIARVTEIHQSAIFKV